MARPKSTKSGGKPAAKAAATAPEATETETTPQPELYTEVLLAQYAPAFTSNPEGALSAAVLLTPGTTPEGWRSAFARREQEAAQENAWTAIAEAANGFHVSEASAGALFAVLAPLVAWAREHGKQEETELDKETGEPTGNMVPAQPLTFSVTLSPEYVDAETGEPKEGGTLVFSLNATRGSAPRVRSASSGNGSNGERSTSRVSAWSAYETGKRKGDTFRLTRHVVTEAGDNGRERRKYAYALDGKPVVGKVAQAILSAHPSSETSKVLRAHGYK